MALVLAAFTCTTTFSYFIYNYMTSNTDENPDSFRENTPLMDINESCIIYETLNPNNMNTMPKNKIITIKEI